MRTHSPFQDGSIALVVLLLGASLACAQSPVQRPFEPTWESLQKYECPEWFRDAKFGIYAHWGPYSVPEYRTEWYSHWMYQPGNEIHEFHVKNFGPVATFGYKEFIPRFTADKFDADAWAELYVAAGAKFAGPVAEHADGFAMWDSALTKWDAKDMGPKRDVVGAMEKALRKRGLKFVATLHHSWLWGWYATPIRNADVHDPRYADFYGPDLPVSAFGRKMPDGNIDYDYPTPLPNDAFCKKWLDKTKEVIDRYRPDLLWFDTKMCTIAERYRLEMVSYYYNRAAQWGRPVVLTYKFEDLRRGTAVIDLERSRMPSIYPAPWLTDTSIARNSWSFTTDLDYYSTDRLVDDLVDIVSKNGCLLLNIAPRPDGTIPEEQRDRLLGIGRWLQVNGEAIYSSRPWRTFGEGPTQPQIGHLADLEFNGFTADDIRFTTKNKLLYAIVLGWPGKQVTIRSLAKGQSPEIIRTVELLGSDGSLKWSRDERGLTVRFPDSKPCEHAFVLRIGHD